jgi:Skp family chaperone for outer membrane proteins
MRFANEKSRMIRALTLAGSVVVVLALMWTFNANVARTQTTTSAKIAVVNADRIFDEIQEKKDFVAKMNNDYTAFQTEQKARAQHLKDQQSARDMLKPDSQQYADADQKLYDMSLEFEFYVQTTTAKIQRQRKKQIIVLFDKITAAVGDVAKSKGLDIVIADVRPVVPSSDSQAFDQMPENTLLGVLAQRNVLYSSANVDISTAVIAKMDADYKGGK